MAGGVLVTDFDGTLTSHDFYQLALRDLLPSDVPDHWDDYRAGRKTHFEALCDYFTTIRADEAVVLRAVDSMGLPEDLAGLLDRLAAAGWRVVVASAGCAWYIERLLAPFAGRLEVHANPGRFEAGRGLVMELPDGSPYFTKATGIDKAAIVRAALADGGRVAFAGDGYPDAPAARLVADRLRFAKADLAAALDAEGVPYRPFAHWSEVVDAVLAEGGGS